MVIKNESEYFTHVLKIVLDRYRMSDKDKTRYYKIPFSNEDTIELYKKDHSELSYLLILLFLEQNQDNEIVIHDLNAFVGYFSNFLHEKILGYMDLESHFFKASDKLKKTFLSSSIYMGDSYKSVDKINKQIVYIRRHFDYFEERIIKEVSSVRERLIIASVMTDQEDFESVSIGMSPKYKDRFTLKVTARPILVLSVNPKDIMDRMKDIDILKYKALIDLEEMPKSFGMFTNIEKRFIVKRFFKIPISRSCIASFTVLI